MLDQRGDVTFSMRELAGRIGYAVTAVYRCYETRGHLLRVLTVKLYELLEEELTDPGLGETVQQQVRTLGERFLHWAVTYPGRYRLMFLHKEPEADLTDDEQEVARSGMYFLATLIAEGLERQEIHTAVAPEVLASLVFASLHGLASLHASGRLEGKAAEDIVGFYSENSNAWLGALLSA